MKHDIFDSDPTHQAFRRFTMYGAIEHHGTEINTIGERRVQLRLGEKTGLERYGHRPNRTVGVSDDHACIARIDAYGSDAMLAIPVLRRVFSEDFVVGNRADHDAMVGLKTPDDLGVLIQSYGHYRVGMIPFRRCFEIGQRLDNRRAKQRRDISEKDYDHHQDNEDRANATYGDDLFGDAIRPNHKTRRSPVSPYQVRFSARL